MRKLIKLFIVLFIGIQAEAQQVPMIKVGEDRLGITSLDIRVDVVGNIATTTYDMLFYNPTASVLEGELAFPLGDGQSVSRLALEVNGKLREAVIVEKELGRVAFEAVVRRSVDPVLLEKGTGNNYKARIYPIPANGHKRVVLAYEQELTYSNLAHYYELPLQFQNTLDEFTLRMIVFGQELQPTKVKGDLRGFEFNRLSGNYVAYYKRAVTVVKTDLKIKIPLALKGEKIVTDKEYAYIYKTLNVDKRAREKSKEIDIYWDVSYSMEERELETELNFLEDYIKYLENVTVNLTTFSNEIISRDCFKIT
ncbi:MAG: hypothetical protein HRT68_14945, partial [Flavobacteriaceae bacterium]|nr:hypothetical protein [Flavobacteriaceae bacterium]